MKRNFFTGIAATALTLVMSSFTLVSSQTNRTQDEFWKQLGWTEKNLKASISHSFFDPQTPDWVNLKKIAPGSRAAFVIVSGNYAKQYVKTPTFEKEYKLYRDGQIKAGTPPPALTREQIAKKNITHLETDINNTEKNCKKATDPNSIKACEQSLDYMKKQLAEFKSGKSAQIDYELRMDEQRYQEAKKGFDEWLKDHPESVQELIKQRLNEFMVLTKGIDYNAVYTGNPDDLSDAGIGYFKNPGYQKKSYKWKQGFFAGKELTETARTFIQQWLKEL